MKKSKIFFSFLLIVLFSFLMVFSFTKIISWSFDNFNTKKNTFSVKNITPVKEVMDNIYTDIISTSDIVDTNLLEVDFDDLLVKNNSVVGWINLPGTKIDYPFVQNSDNDYYLFHSFDKSYNEAGWIFLDYRNNINELDSNTIIYGHGRLDGTMFGSLRDTLNDEWFNNEENHVVKISSLSYNYLFEVFSIYKIRTTNDYLYNNFQTSTEYNKFLGKITSRSLYDFKVSVATKDKILTLSTCYNNSEKLVLHAKLIKQQKRY